MGSESTTRSLSLSLSLYLSVVRVHAHTFTVFLPLSRSREKKERTKRRKRERRRTEAGEGETGSRGEGEVWESLHASRSTSARVITRSEGERASTVSRVHALFVHGYACSPPRGGCTYTRRLDTAKAPSVRTEFPRENARARAHNASRNERVRASYFYIYATHTQPARRALRKSPRATAKGGSKVDLFFFAEWGKPEVYRHTRFNNDNLWTYFVISLNSVRV